MSFPTVSSRSNPCPICGRDFDGDCRISDNGERVLCHRGSTFFPPAGPDTRSGEVITGKDGRQWGYVGETSDGRAAQFALHQPRSTSPAPPRTGAAAPLPTGRAQPVITGPITLAQLPQPAAPPPAHWPSGHVLTYSDHQRVVVHVKPDGDKDFYANHLGADGQWVKNKGEAPWPLWQQAEALTHGTRHWILEAEGEKCSDHIRAAGYVAIAQPGHNHAKPAITQRYQTLVAAGIRGVIYLADNDKQGQAKADKCKAAATDAGLPFLVLQAAALWPDLPAGGSIDDAPGSYADRITVIEHAVALALEDHQQQVAAKSGDDTKTRLNKAELQAFVADTFQVEWNELTRDVELGGHPMGTNLHLADSFLAHTHGIEASKQAAADSFEFVARSNPYNPVRRYLQNLRHRSDLRLISMPELAAAFAIEPHDHLSQQLLARHLAAAVQRGMTPGSKHDQILVLCGGQGTGKSQSIAALAGSWYDSATRVEDLEHRDFLARLNSAWLFEFDECEHTLQKRTAAEFKGFLSRSRDRYVEKFEKAAQDHPRRSVAFGTTNQREFLNDHTGNRRAWVIEVGNRLLNPDWIAANRDSIWATVITWIDWGLPTYIAADDPLHALAADRAADAQLSDMWEGTLIDFLSRRTMADGPGIAQDDLAREALAIDELQMSRDVQMRITRIVTDPRFRTHGGAVAWESSKRRYAGRSSRAGYVPRQADAAALNNGRRSNAPTSATQITMVGTELGTQQTPWQNCSLTTLFQLFQPKSSSSSNGTEEPRGVVGDAKPGWPRGRIRSDRRNTPVVASDLSDPSDDLTSGRNGSEPYVTQQCDQNGSRSGDLPQSGSDATLTRNVDPAPAGPLPQVGDHVEVRVAPNVPWEPGYRVLSLDGKYIKLAAPNSGRPCSKRLAARNRTWRSVA